MLYPYEFILCMAVGYKVEVLFKNKLIIQINLWMVQNNFQILKE